MEFFSRFHLKPARATELASRAGRRPLFTIIIPSLRCADKLERSIQSVLRQPAGMYELFIIDGDSKDATLDVIKKYETELAGWISEPDDGIYFAMNKGIAMSSAPYLYFLGAGDTLRDGVLERIATKLPRWRVGFVYGNVFMHDKRVVWDGPWSRAKFRTRTPCHQAIFFDRRIFRRHGNFEGRFKAAADYAMNIRCFGDRWIAKIFVDEIIADYEGAGFSANNRDEAFRAERPALLLKHLGVKPKKK